MNRIAITGKMRSGKSTISDYLVYSRGFRSISFADDLKHYANEIFDYLIGGDSKPRRLYQEFGQKMREIDPDIWIKRAEIAMRVYEDMRSTRGIVIDDLRQPNEYDWARANGFTIIRVSASEDTRLARARMAGDIFSEEDFRHETEQYVDGFAVDFEIDNNGSAAELERAVDEILVEMTERERAV